MASYKRIAQIDINTFKPYIKLIIAFQGQKLFFTTLGKPANAMKSEVRVTWRQCNTKNTVEVTMRKHRGPRPRDKNKYNHDLIP